jgi:argininosuccinate lyase
VEDTGRIKRAVTPSARRVLFGRVWSDSVYVELQAMTRIDCAHLVMLVEGGIVDRARASTVLKLIGELEASEFKPLEGQAAPRGIYLLYEDYLIRQLGADTGGVLHTARSRNDLNATSLLLRLRAPYLNLLRQLLRLQAVLLRRAQRYAAVVMPLYTHYQAAVPGTYGHYLAGVASALQRDIADLSSLLGDLNRCPLGAGAVGGTSLPIRPERTAQLLGFEQPLLNSVDAVASRDLVLRLLASAAILGVTLSRISTDLLLWSTAEFGFLTLPDQLVGSSSVMPQKRNPYLLEHVQGRGVAALGAFVHAASAMQAKPFTNSIAVGTEGVNPAWQALQNTTEAVLLLRLVVAGAIPQPEVMLRHARDAYVTATELANRLVTDGGMAFRSAHYLVGSIIRDAIERNESSLQDVMVRWQEETQTVVSPDDLDPAAVAQATAYGGGPSATALQSCLQQLRGEWSLQMRQLSDQARKWHDAEAALNNEVHQLHPVR